MDGNRNQRFGLVTVFALKLGSGGPNYSGVPHPAERLSNGCSILQQAKWAPCQSESDDLKIFNPLSSLTLR